MVRFGILLCALVLSGCNSVLPGASAPDASAPQAIGSEAGVFLAQEGASADQTGTIVPPPLAELDCAPRAGAITCN